MLNFDSPNEIKKFIQENESSYYEGKNVDGERVMIRLEKGQGMDVMTIHPSKPKWWEVQEYDADGYLVGTSYESTGE